MLTFFNALPAICRCLFFMCDVFFFGTARRMPSHISRKIEDRPANVGSERAIVYGWVARRWKRWKVKGIGRVRGWKRGRSGCNGSRRLASAAMDANGASARRSGGYALMEEVSRECEMCFAQQILSYGQEHF